MNYKLSGDFTVLKAYGISLLLYSVGYSVFHGLPRLWRTVQSKFLFLLAAQMFLSLFFSRSGLLHTKTWWGYEGISFLVSALTLLFITMSLVDSEEKLRKTMVATVATAGLAGIYIIRGWLAGDTRPGWPFGDANYFALYAVSVIPIALAVSAQQAAEVVRWACYACVGLCTVGLLLSRSRAGLAAFAIFGLFYLVREKRRVQSLVFVGFMIGCLFFLPSAIERMTNPTKWDMIATEARKIVWRAALEMTLDNPLFGVGPGHGWFLAEIPGYTPVYLIAHNSYLEISAEAGIPALLAFVFMLFFSWRSARQSERDYVSQGNTYLANLSRGIEGSLLAFSIAATSVSASFLRFGWFVIFLTMLLRDHRFLLRTDAGPSRATSASGNAQSPRPLRTTFQFNFQKKTVPWRSSGPRIPIHRRLSGTRKSKWRDYILG